MAAREIIIKDKNTGKIVQQFDERRSENGRQYSSTPKLPFGMRPAELIQICTIIIATVLFVHDTRGMLKAHDASIKYLIDYAKSSDRWHSQMSGYKFEKGEPVKDLNVNGYRKLFQSRTEEVEP